MHKNRAVSFFSSGSKTTQPDIPTIDVAHSGNTTVLTLHGAWTVHTISLVLKNLERLTHSLSGTAEINISSVQTLDTAGALVINSLAQRLDALGIKQEIISGNKDHTALLKTCVPVIVKRDAPSAFFGITDLLEAYGKHVVSFLTFTVELIGFLGQFITLLFASLLRPHKIRWVSIVYFMEQTGLRAVPIVALLCFLIGMVVAYMCMDELAKFGAQALTIKLLEVSILREMGILITAIIVAGRSSSSFTAQIGSMVANEEIDALRSMGLNPVPLLVVPRVIALIITLPMLVFVANVMGIIGGAVAICPVLDINFEGFLLQFYAGAKPWNLYVGLIKAPFCALAIGLVGCYQGFKATSNAESVGFLTTTAVVQSIFLVIVIDAIFAIFFASLGI